MLSVGVNWMGALYCIYMWRCDNILFDWGEDAGNVGALRQCTQVLIDHKYGLCYPIYCDSEVRTAGPVSGDFIL